MTPPVWSTLTPAGSMRARAVPVWAASVCPVTTETATSSPGTPRPRRCGTQARPAPPVVRSAVDDLTERGSSPRRRERVRVQWTHIDGDGHSAVLPDVEHDDRNGHREGRGLGIPHGHQVSKMVT